MRELRALAGQQTPGGLVTLVEGFSYEPFPDLTEEERAAFVSRDVGRLYKLGVHGLILRPFTLLHKMPEPCKLPRRLRCRSAGRSRRGSGGAC